MERVPVLCVPDRELEHVLEPPRAEVAEQQEPAAERTRHARGEDAGARNEVVPQRAEPLDGRGGRGDALPAQGKRLPSIR